MLRIYYYFYSSRIPIEMLVSVSRGGVLVSCTYETRLQNSMYKGVFALTYIYKISKNHIFNLIQYPPLTLLL
jgi:hypothetical protein